MTDQKHLDGLLTWRNIGPFRGGRVLSVAGDVNQPNVFYFGACAGGVWKTDDGGTYWQCISDGYFNTASIGAIAVSEFDPNVIYAGTGEATIRIDVSHGDGVYKSTDAGRTWQHMGLEDTRHIGKIRIHPQDPDTVYVAALGHAFGPNEQRGVFKSTDGGETWQHVLFVSEDAGAIDLTIDHTNPRILFATIWHARRSFWDIQSGGDDSGIWKSTDGGETWTNITRNKGLPNGVLGKMGIAASPVKAGRVWALIEAEKGGMYRSDNYGETWEYVAENDLLISRAWYYMHVTADPTDGDTVWVNNLRLWKSTDGGKNYDEISTPHGDNHDIWIDPNNANRMVQGNDGGACVSYNGGATWSTLYNQPTSQFYHAAASTEKPYKVYGTQQDNSSIGVPSASHNFSIMWEDCFPAGTGESGYIQVHPDDPAIVYLGAIGSSPGGGNALQRYNHRNKQVRLITTWPESERGEGAGSHKYRFAWTYPIILSPHDPNTIYIGGNLVFKSTNEGQSWEAISPDLTVADPDTLKPSGGPINRDAVGAETYATVYALAESLHEAGVLWAGSDDGKVHITKDGGANWTDITPDALPEKTMISMLEASPHDPATCYMAATKYKLDDYTPYLFKTTDFGATWTNISNGIREDDFTRVIRADAAREGLLYAGTETGVYVSFDDGVNWQALQLNLPVCPIHDLIVHDNDLIAATHGRAFWILDDLTKLHQFSDDITSKALHLMQPRETTRILPRIFEGQFGGSPGKNYMGSMGLGAAYLIETNELNQKTHHFFDSGTNPPKGAVISYWLKDDADDLTLTFMDSDGNILRTVTNLTDEIKKFQEENPKAPKKVYTAASAGWNSFLWDLRVEDGIYLDDNDPFGAVPTGPIVPPGEYQVQISTGDETQTHSFTLVADPGAEGTQEDLQAQYDLLKAIQDKLSEGNVAINAMRKIRAQLAQWNSRLSGSQNGSGELAQAAADLKDAVFNVEAKLLYPDLKEGWRGMLNKGVQLMPKLSALPAVVEAGDYRPTDQSVAVYDKLAGEIDAVLAAYHALVESDLTAFNKRIVESEISVIGI